MFLDATNTTLYVFYFILNHCQFHRVLMNCIGKSVEFRFKVCPCGQNRANDRQHCQNLSQGDRAGLVRAFTAFRFFRAWFPLTGSAGHG